MLQIGSNFTHKNINRSIKTLTSLPNSLHHNTLLYIIKQNKPQKFKTLTKKHNIHNNVHFFSKHNNISKLITTTNLLLHPTYQKTTKIVLLKTITTKLPILTTTIYNYTHYIINTNYNKTITKPFHQKTLNKILHKTLTQSSLHQT